ncbi:hypothetical protein ACFQ67_00270 [Streptomyces sp. NPDC056488]|uniref:hypothetical protein n=1 Tax=Streptomyces sp. NPDC056488 TaxID=3345836 RepID=UPI00369DB6A1
MPEQPTRDQLYALNALMRRLEDPLEIYNRCLRKAWRTLTDSPENNAAQAKGNAALLEIEQAIRQWVAEYPVVEQPRKLTVAEHDRAWHAIEGASGEPDADPCTVLAAVLRALRIEAPTAEDEQAYLLAKRTTC